MEGGGRAAGFAAGVRLGEGWRTAGGLSGWWLAAAAGGPPAPPHLALLGDVEVVDAAARLPRRRQPVAPVAGHVVVEQQLLEQRGSSPPVYAQVEGQVAGHVLAAPAGGLRAAPRWAGCAACSMAPCLRNPGRPPLSQPHLLLMKPVAASSRMLASTSGSPVRPCSQRCHSSSSCDQGRGVPAVPSAKNSALPCLSAKNLAGGAAIGECSSCCGRGSQVLCRRAHRGIAWRAAQRRRRRRPT